RPQRPRESTGHVADGETDAPFANINPEHTHTSPCPESRVPSRSPESHVPVPAVLDAILPCTPSHPVKRTVLALLVVCLGTTLGCSGRRPPEKFRQKLIILGFDGMDPRLVQKWMDEGKLPNLKKLSGRSGGVH